jgi:alkanesulfonate monooxygenase SsuD/methylene tetrahydromethanopterin reductase-like flavin-dependent oxidoreductase (luciferase family)
MAITFGLSGLPEELYDAALANAAGYRDAYDRSLEVLGPEFTTLWGSDHFQFGDSPTMECWTRLTFLAGRYERFKVGSLVLGQAYRNPALLAKMAATLQFTSGGRLVLGIGAAWHEEEFRSYNFAYAGRGQRVDQLIETLQILRLMWQGGPATFEGEHYALRDAYCVPAPTTPIPIIVGAQKPRMLRVAAQYADGWNFDANPELFPQWHARICEHLSVFGRSVDDFEFSLNVEVAFPEDTSDFQALIPTEFPDYDLDQYIYGPTPDDAIKRLQPFVDAGVTHFQVGVTDLRTLKLFANEVAPALAAV